MSQIEVERYLGRLITDAGFRSRAAESLPEACFQEGIALSPEEMALLSHVHFEKFGQIAESIDDSIKRK